VSFAVDANLLLYASDESSRLHGRALSLTEEIARGPEIVYVFWPVIMAYLRIATHPAIFTRPLSREEATRNIQSLIGRSHIQTPGEQERFWDRYQQVADDAAPTGNLVSDAHIVALMLENGVRTIWTRDRDYRRFQGIEVRDPFDEVTR
jgi:toxin-antitoxin system PIN domain toxin